MTIAIESKVPALTAVIDGDLVAFRCAASAEGESEAWIATSRINSFIDEIVAVTGASSYEVWLSGKNNFRYEVYPEYKANRKGQPRPKWEADCKAYLQLTHNAQILDNGEADDALGFRMHELRAAGEPAICVTNDKDLKQIAGDHYDPVKKLLFTVSEEEADRWFYYQLLVGDPVDNLKGVPGIGPKKAEKLLSEWFDEWAYTEADPMETLHEHVLQRVEEMYPCPEAFEQEAKCLWMWRERNGIWSRK